MQWQWNISKGNNSLWHPYSADVVDYIEDMFQKKQPSIDLSKKFSDLEYTIDFSSKMQVIIKTILNLNGGVLVYNTFPLNFKIKFPSFG